MENAEADCRAVLERLYLYLDRELEAALCAEIDRHLELCPPCFERVGFEREIKLMIASRCRETLPPEIVERLRARLRELL